jgi:hypothetical protein
LQRRSPDSTCAPTFAKLDGARSIGPIDAAMPIRASLRRTRRWGGIDRPDIDRPRRAVLLGWVARAGSKPKVGSHETPSPSHDRLDAGPRSVGGGCPARGPGEGAQTIVGGQLLNGSGGSNGSNGGSSGGGGSAAGSTEAAVAGSNSAASSSSAASRDAAAAGARAAHGRVPHASAGAGAHADGSGAGRRPASVHGAGAYSSTTRGGGAAAGSSSSWFSSTDLLLVLLVAAGLALTAVVTARVGRAQHG